MAAGGAGHSQCHTELIKCCTNPAGLGQLQSGNRKKGLNIDGRLFVQLCQWEWP